MVITLSLVFFISLAGGPWPWRAFFDIDLPAPDERMFWILIVLVVGMIFLLPLWIMWKNQRRAENIILDRVARKLAAKTYGRGMGGRYRLSSHHKGVPFTFSFDSPDAFSFSPAHAALRIAVPSTGSFRITREGALDRETKHFDLPTDLQTGDSSFDSEFFIMSAKADFILSILKQREAREIVRKIFDMGYTTFRLKNGSLEAVWSGVQLNEDADPDNILQTVASMAAFTREMPVTPQYRSVTTASRWDMNTVLDLLIPAAPIMVLAVGAFALAWGYLWYPPLDPGKMFLSSAMFSLPLLCAYLLGASIYYRGKWLGHRMLMIVIAVSLLAFPLAGFGIEMTLNAILDKALPSSHVVTVVREDLSSVGMSQHYYIEVDSWRRESATETIKVPISFYERITLNQTKITVVTRPGKFGFEWIVSISVE